MEVITRKSSNIRVRIVALFCLVVLAVSMLFVTYAQAVSSPTPGFGQRLITVHDRGRERGILTGATTLRLALEEAGIHLDPNDTVEPALDEPLVANNYEANIYRARPITIVDGAVKTKVMSSYQTAKQITDQAEIPLQDEDITTITANTDMVSQGAGVQLSIKRATSFTLVLYGEKTTAYTQKKTVADMLAEKEITIGKNDTLSVVPDTKMKAGMTVEIWRNGKQTVTEEKEIDFEIEKIQDMDKEIGYRKVKTPGEKGKRSVTYEVVMKNGKEVKRKEIQSVMLSAPKKQVEIVGAKPSFSGDFAAALAKLRACESGGNYANKRNPLYRGAYQFDYSTWGNKYGIYDPADASPAQQDQAARELYERRGWQPWPHCGADLPDTYR